MGQSIKTIILFLFLFLFGYIFAPFIFENEPVKNETVSIQKIPDVARDSNGKIKRSQSAVHQFLKEQGLTKIPKGYHVDHIVPLWKGGSDTPNNMRLITIEEHHKKTAREAHERAQLRKKE